MPGEKASGRQNPQKKRKRKKEVGISSFLQEQEDKGLGPREPHSVQQVEEIATQAAD